MTTPVQAPPKASQLSLHFDPAGLQADLSMLGSGEWTAHFNRQFYNGDWSGVALRSSDGANNQLYSRVGEGEFSDTALFQKCGHLREVIETFKCPLRSVRLLRLTAGSNIREHRDYDLGYDAGEVRIHVPVVTNPDVEFYLDNRRITMNEGECWYLDLHLPHRVQNRGLTDRVHLVIDCQLNDWLRELIAQGTSREGEVCGFEKFRHHVLGDRALQDQLIGLGDRNAFIARVVELGQQRGFDFLEGDVEATLQAEQRAWIERRIP